MLIEQLLYVLDCLVEQLLYVRDCLVEQLLYVLDCLVFHSLIKVLYSMSPIRQLSLRILGFTALEGTQYVDDFSMLYTI